MVGYDSVVRAARRAGLNAEPTPSVALGSYEDTPLEMAGAYTVFANRGVYVKPYLISSIRAQNGSEIYSYQPETRAALDPRVAYLMVNMLEEVVRSGTGVGIRGKGFNAPAAGKTDTSRDGWLWVLLLTCRVSFGWGSTTIASSASKAQNRLCRSGPNS